MAHIAARQVRKRHLALGLLLVAARFGRSLQLLDLGGHGRQIGGYGRVRRLFRSALKAADMAANSSRLRIAFS